MATSTFAKSFSLESTKVNEFVKETRREVSPTIKKDFQSKLVRENDVKVNLLKALR